MENKNYQYEIDGLHKFAEEDIYADGCQPGTAREYYLRETFTAETLRALVDKVKAFTGQDDDGDVLLDSGGELGRLDVQVTEREDGCAATPGELERWRAGELRLWAATYTGRVEKIQREGGIKLEGADGLGGCVSGN